MFATASYGQCRKLLKPRSSADAAGQTPRDAFRGIIGLG